MRHSIWIAAAALAPLLFFAGAPEAADYDISADDLVEVRSEGYAEGTGFDARRSAILDAQREAVGRLAESLVAPEYAAALQPIQAKGEQFVHRYGLLRYDRLDNSTSVEIDAYIVEQDLKQAVADIVGPLLPARPSVALLIGESASDPDAMALNPAATAKVLRDGLEKGGFRLLAEAEFAALSEAFLRSTVLGNVEAGQQFAKALPADVSMVVRITVTTEPPAEGVNLARHRAEAVLRCYRGLDGKMTEAVQSSAAVFSANAAEGAAQAINDASLKLLRDAAVAGILTVAGSQSSEDVLITVEAPGSRERFDELAAVLQAEPEVLEVETLYYSDALARLRVRYEGPMVYLVDTLTLGPYAGKKLVVLRAVARNVVVGFK